MTEIETVKAFIGALERFDFDAASALCADDIVYQNVPLPPARGKPAVEKTLRAFEHVMDSFEVKIVNIASNGRVVLTERVDYIGKGPFRLAPWVCGTFEVKDGKITLWRDYFDWMSLTTNMLTAAPRALLRVLSSR
jgi:limonene-1,2-epoxide hydrolase